MLSLWTVLQASDVEAYAASLLLPSYVAHLQLQSIDFSTQARNCHGCEPLRLTYVGEGRLEELSLDPEQHALAMIRFRLPGIDTSRLHLPRDEATWSWAAHGEHSESMRIFFAPTTEVLGRRVAPNSAASVPLPNAYVSVTRGHAFVGRTAVEAYLRAWLDHLGLTRDTLQCQWESPSGGIEFRSDGLGGELLLDNFPMARDMLHFAGLDTVLAQVADLVEFRDDDRDSFPTIAEEGVYLPLCLRDEMLIQPIKTTANDG